MANPLSELDLDELERDLRLLGPELFARWHGRKVVLALIQGCRKSPAFFNNFGPPNEPPDKGETR